MVAPRICAADQPVFCIITIRLLAEVDEPSAVFETSGCEIHFLVNSDHRALLMLSWVFKKRSGRPHWLATSEVNERCLIVQWFPEDWFQVRVDVRLVKP